MATRGRWRRGRRSSAGGRGSAPTEPESKGETSSTPSQQPTPKEDVPTIRKGVYLSALIYVEGEMPAPEDFTAQATSALKEALGEALKANPGGLSMSVKRVEVQNDVEVEDEGEGSKEEKFQF